MQPGTPLTVITADALRVTELPGDPTRLVANLPYNVSVPVLLHLLEHFPSLAPRSSWCRPRSASGSPRRPDRRSTASPSVKAAWYGALVDRRARSAAQVFWPVPNVDSMLVAFERGEQPGTEDGTASPPSPSSTPRSSSGARCCASRSPSVLGGSARGIRAPRGGRHRPDRARRAADRRGLPRGRAGIVAAVRAVPRPWLGWRNDQPGQARCARQGAGQDQRLPQGRHARRRRVPRRRDRLPGRLALRRGRASSTADDFSVEVGGTVELSRVPTDGTNIAIKAARLLAARTGYPRRRAHRDREARAGHRRHGRRIGGCRGHPARLRRPLGHRAAARRDARASPASSAPTCRSRSPAAPRSAPAAATSSRPRSPRAPSTGCSRSPTSACRPRPSTASSTTTATRHAQDIFPADPRPTVDNDVLQALRAGDPHMLANAMHNDLQAPALHLEPVARRRARARRAERRARRHRLRVGSDGRLPRRGCRLGSRAAGRPLGRAAQRRAGERPGARGARARSSSAAAR